MTREPSPTASELNEAPSTLSLTPDPETPSTYQGGNPGSNNDMQYEAHASEALNGSSGGGKGDAMDVETAPPPTPSPLTHYSSNSVQSEADAPQLTTVTLNGAKADIAQSLTTATENKQAEGEPQPHEVDPALGEMEVDKQPTLLDKALDAMPKKGPKQLYHGEIMLVLDENDLSKTLRFDSKVLLHHIPSIRTDLRGLDEASVNGIGALAVLRQDATDKLPVLKLQALNVPALAVKEDATSTDSTAAEATTNVKAEPGTVADHPAPQSAGGPQRTIDWPAAYECFFRILVSLPAISIQKCRMPLNAEAALPLVDGLVAIGEHYDCLQTIRSAFQAFAVFCIPSGGLYRAIAGSPANCLAGAIKLRSESVYRKAFVHLVGMYPDIDIRRLHAEVVATIESRSRELYAKRSHVDVDLLLTSLKMAGKEAEKGKKKKSNAEPEEEFKAIVDQRHQPAIYTIVNVWRDWVADHVSHLRDIEKGQAPASVRSSTFCAHPASDPGSAPECLSVAGFYRTLYKGGDCVLDG